METDLVEEVMSRLDKLGEISVQGFEVLVRQAVVEGIKNTAWGLLWLALTILILVLAKRIWQERFLAGDFNTYYSTGRWDPEEQGYNKEVLHSYHRTVAVCVALASAITIPTAIAMLLSGFMRLYNPEFYAIRFILDRASL